MWTQQMYFEFSHRLATFGFRSPLEYVAEGFCHAVGLRIVELYKKKENEDQCHCTHHHDHQHRIVIIISIIINVVIIIITVVIIIIIPMVTYTCGNPTHLQGGVGAGKGYVGGAGPTLRAPGPYPCRHMPGGAQEPDRG